MRPAIACIVAVTGATGATVGCFPPPPHLVSLRDRKVLSVSLTPEGGPAICPGQGIPLAVDIAALHDGETTPTHVHVGRKVASDRAFTREKLDIRSAQGTVDGEGIFHASPDPRVSVGGFFLEVHPPNGEKTTVRIPVSYGCVQSAGVQVPSAAEGARGLRGDNIGRPTKAAPGGPGSVGEKGHDAPDATAYVTWVKTPDHEKLIAAIIDTRGNHALTLASGEAPLQLAARGGAGGHGGRGGQGGDGITWCAKEHTYRSRGRGSSGRLITVCDEHLWSVPGDGGRGGDGGDGGAGGDLEVHIDARYPELAQLITTDVAGGAGGLAGASGAEGETNPRFDWDVFPTRFREMHGMYGAHGSAGHAGRSGATRIVFDDVRAHFSGLGAIEPLPAPVD